MESLKPQEDVFDKFFTHRDYLIIQFTNGDISKREFIEEHYDSIQSLNLQPFKNGIDSFEKGIYNYQYYNMVAKYCYMRAKDKKMIEKHPDKARIFWEMANYNYNQKDKSTLQLLEHLNFENIEAYFIKANSKSLKNKLYEIVLREYDSIILHSKNQFMLKRLKEEKVFKRGIRKSLIDAYINQKY